MNKKVCTLTIALVLVAILLPALTAQAQSQSTVTMQGSMMTVTYDGRAVSRDTTDVNDFDDLSHVSGLTEQFDKMGADIDALKSGGTGGDGRRTMKALGKAISQRYAGKMEAKIFAKFLKANDGDSAAVRTDPDYIAAMDRLKGSKIEEAKAEAFVADLMALLDRGPGAGGGGSQAIDLDNLKTEITSAVVAALEPNMNTAIQTKVNDAMNPFMTKVNRGFAATASLFSGRDATGKKVEKDKIIDQLTTGKY